MCRTATIVLCAVLTAAPLAAQRRDPDSRSTTLLARAESLEAALQQSAQARDAEDQALHRGQVFQAGRVVAVLWEVVNPVVGQRLLATVDSTIGSFGGGPAGLLDSLVVVQVLATDTARVLSRSALTQRRRIELDWVEADPDAGATRLINGIGRLFRTELDTVWQNWLPTNYGIEWSNRERLAARNSLLEPGVATGQGCLTGRVSQCRLWLGLDDDARPIAMRYRGSEIRQSIAGWTAWSGLRDRQACVRGDDAACIRFAEAHATVPPIPAPDIARASLLRALWTLHGPQALERAFADTRGSIGERLARAASIREDSFVTEWRVWTLGLGRSEPLAATLPQAVIVLLSVIVVVWTATRSGRWR